jgi:hypothetical protein
MWFTKNQKNSLNLFKVFIRNFINTILDYKW